MCLEGEPKRSATDSGVILRWGMSVLEDLQGSV
jgi:hypothetical protein